MRSPFLLAVVVVLAGCSSSPAAPPPAGPASPPASATALPNRCHLEAKAAMAAALERDGNFDSLPQLPDRSMGIAACRGLSSEQLDEIALALQEELKPQIMAAAARSAASSTKAP